MELKKLIKTIGKKTAMQFSYCSEGMIDYETVLSHSVDGANLKYMVRFELCHGQGWHSLHTLNELVKVNRVLCIDIVDANTGESANCYTDYGNK